MRECFFRKIFQEARRKIEFKAHWLANSPYRGSELFSVGLFIMHDVSAGKMLIEHAKITNGTERFSRKGSKMDIRNA